jgi:hypothetical protein
MFARIPPASLLLSVLAGFCLVPSCTKSEDTEPFVPASEGATQPEGGGDLLTEDQACERLRDAAASARKELGCSGPALPECPSFLRPGGGSGCYEYSSESVEACEDAYEAAFSCQTLAPCIATAVRNDALPTCELPSQGEGGAGGAAGGAPGMGGEAPGQTGGAPSSEGGAPAEGGAGGAVSEQGGAPAGGAGG